ncbi:MAG TPA: LptF/LptG family permease [Nautiliaceae bacterium]|nr:LptF/LptG family permease [Nautiliaceae bacterium]
MFFSFIVKKYVKNLLLILFSLSLFYIIIDAIGNFSKLPSAINLQVLYFYYNFLYSTDIFYPLSLVFAFLLTLLEMVKFNELISLYSVGFSIKKILKPFLIISFFVFFIFIIFGISKYAYSKEYAKAILNKQKYTTANLFLKYQNNIIYIEKINPLLQEAYNMEIFVIRNNNLVKAIFVKKAIFKDDKWFCKNAKIIYFYKDKIIKEQKDISFLKNFKPKILSNLKKLNSISFYDAFIAIKVFKDVNINNILAILFFKIFTPLSLIGLIVIFLIYVPIHPKVSNLSFFMIKSVFITILVWGIEILMYKFVKQGVMSPYSLILPTLLVYGYILYLIRRKNGF